MNNAALGIFHRAFPVELPDGPIRFMTAEVKNVADIDRLRFEKWVSKSESSVFTLGELAFGYGNGMEKFADNGFSETQVILKDSPRLAEGLIIEGLVDDARTRGRHYFGIYRSCVKMISDSDYIVRNDFIIRVGYDLKAVHWNHEESTMFALIIEPSWTIQRLTGNKGTNYKFSPDFEVDLLSVHSVEPADDYIMSFVDSHREFLLPCGGKARLKPEPLTVFTETTELL